MKVKLRVGDRLHAGSYVFERGRVYDVERSRDILRLIAAGKLEEVEEKKREKKKEVNE